MAIFRKSARMPCHYAPVAGTGGEANAWTIDRTMPRLLTTTWDQYLANDRLACVFSPDECEKIIETFATSGGLYPSHKNVPGRDPATAPRWISSADNATNWMYSRLLPLVTRWNDRWFKFRIDICADFKLFCVQPGDEAKWCVDMANYGYSRRKLSAMVVLSRPETYTGGTIEFFEDEYGSRTFDMKAGDAIVYASWLQYRIQPVTEGRLWILSSWWMGDRPIR